MTFHLQKIRTFLLEHIELKANETKRLANPTLEEMEARNAEALFFFFSFTWNITRVILSLETARSTKAPTANNEEHVIFCCYSKHQRGDNHPNESGQCDSDEGRTFVFI